MTNGVLGAAGYEPVADNRARGLFLERDSNAIAVAVSNVCHFAQYS